MFEALEWVSAQFGFRVIGVDPDNSPEFINNHMFNYSPTNNITFTR
jgi:hypothetical protein